MCVQVRRNRRYVAGFHVRWREAGGKGVANGGAEFAELTVDGSGATESRLEGLRPHTAYEVNVRPWYRSVVGVESKTLLVRTREDGTSIISSIIIILFSPIIQQSVPSVL